MSDRASATGSSFKAVRPATSDHGPPDAQLAVAREMIGALESLTASGQRQAMTKIVALLHGHVSNVSSRLTSENRRWLAAVVERLDKESGRMHPDPSRFTDRAEDVLTLLAAVR